MKIITRRTFLTASLVLSLFMAATSYADPVSCQPPETCAPCGYVATTANLPAYGPGVNPLINYTATASASCCRGFFSGFYLGAAYGIGVFDHRLRVDGLNLVRTDDVITNNNFNSALDRIYSVTNFNVGFNLVVDYFLLGGEIGYNVRSRTGPISYTDFVDFAVTPPIVVNNTVLVAISRPCRVRIDLNQNQSASADILPGFVYCRFAAYLRLGVEQDNFTWRRRFCFPVVSVLTLPPTIAGQEFIESRRKTGTGYRLGGGIGYAAGPHISFHANYLHVFGTRMSFIPNRDLLPVFPVGTIASQLFSDNVIEPQRDEVTIGVRFRF